MTYIYDNIYMLRYN